MKFNDNLNKTIEEEIKNICIKNKPKKNILVLAGGGMKGLGILGSIKYLEEIFCVKPKKKCRELKKFFYSKLFIILDEIYF